MPFLFQSYQLDCFAGIGTCVGMAVKMMITVNRWSMMTDNEQEQSMLLWLMVLAVMLIVVGVMSVGVLLGRKPISGSCGGLNNLGLKQGCDICGGKDEVCEEQQRKEKLKLVAYKPELAFDASRKPGA